MDRKVLLCGLFMCASSLMAQSEQGFTIKGSLQGLPDSLKVKLVDIESGEQNRIIAESDINNGNFMLKGSVPNVRLCELMFYKNNNTGYSHATIKVRMMVENTPMTVSSDVTYDSIVNADYSQKQEMLLKVKGGKASAEFDDYKKELNSIELTAKKVGYKAA